MVDDDLSDTAELELELMDTDVMEQLPHRAAVTGDTRSGTDAPLDEEPKEPKAKPGFDPYNHS